MEKSYEQFLDTLSRPARSALLFAEIDSFEKLAAHSEKQILALHGIGPKSMPVMRSALAKKELHFAVLDSKNPNSKN